MCASQATRLQQPVGVLLGGSGRVRAQALPMPRLAALLCPTGLTARADRSGPVIRAALAAA
jgi:hypothetical protein